MTDYDMGEVAKEPIGALGLDIYYEDLLCVFFWGGAGILESI